MYARQRISTPGVTGRATDGQRHAAWSQQGGKGNWKGERKLQGKSSAGLDKRLKNAWWSIWLATGSEFGRIGAGCERTFRLGDEGDVRPLPRWGSVPLAALLSCFQLWPRLLRNCLEENRSLSVAAFVVCFFIRD